MSDKILTGREELKQILAEVQADRAQADLQVLAWQARVKEGDYVLRLYPLDEANTEWLTIYGIIEATEPEYQNYRLRNVRCGRWFSVKCVDGEYGSAHVATLYGVLYPEVFEMARKLGWPDWDTLSAMIRRGRGEA